MNSWPSSKPTVIPHSRPMVSSSDEESVAKALRSGLLDGSFWMDEFTNALNSLLGSGRVLVTRTATEALALLLSDACDGPRGEVILPTYVCRDVETAIIKAGLIPVHADVDLMGVITGEQVEARITTNTAAVIAVNLFGHPAPTDVIHRVVSDKLGQRLVIEDACHSLAFPDGPSSHRASGSGGLPTVYSFGATKCLTAGGAGGAIQLPRTWEGSQLDSSSVGLGGNRSPLSGLESAMGLSQIAQYPSMRERRQRIRGHFDEHATGLFVPSRDHAPVAELFRYVFHSRLGFDHAEAWFSERSIVVRRGVDSLLRRGNPSDSSQEYPQAEWLHQHTVSIPFYPALSDAEVSRVAEALSRYPR